MPPTLSGAHPGISVVNAAQEPVAPRSRCWAPALGLPSSPGGFPTPLQGPPFSQGVPSETTGLAWPGWARVPAPAFSTSEQAAAVGGTDSCSPDTGAPVGGQTLPTPDCPARFQMLLLEIFADHIFHFPDSIRFIE